MVSTPEQQARERIDALLHQAGWVVSDAEQVNLHANRGVAIREFPLKAAHGVADYLLYIKGKAAGVIEAKREGATLSGVEVQSVKYTTGLPQGLPAWYKPLPFSYQSTGAETHFTNGLDPTPRSRTVFAFHRPEYLAALLDEANGLHSRESGNPGVANAVAYATAAYDTGYKTFLPFPERVNANLKAWLSSQGRHCREGGNPESFTTEQLKWLEMIRGHIAANLGIETGDFEYAPFTQEGGLGKVHQLFGPDLTPIMENLNTALVA